MQEPTYPQTDTRQTERQRERQGTVVDGAEQEFERARDTLQQMREAELNLNEGGRTNESDERGNPRGTTDGIPLPSDWGDTDEWSAYH